MGFFEPIVFAPAGLLLAAVLATYFLRPKRPIRPVSSTLLWIAALHDLEAQKPWRRLPPTLLLLLQVAALAAMVAALARPFVLTPQSTGAFTVLLLDASASMQATDVKPSRFEVARSRANQLIDALEPGQQVALVSLDAQPRVVTPPTSDSGLVKRALASLQPSARSANLQTALALAGNLAQDHADAQIVIVGDGDLDRSQVPPSLGVPVRWLGVGVAGAPNLAVAGLATRDSDGRLSALARVTNFGQQSASADVLLDVDGRRFDSRPVTVDAGASSAVQWDDLPSSTHTLSARLSAPDSLALDDAAWAVVGGDRLTRVLLVSDGNVFLERALALREGLQVTRVSPNDYASQNQTFDLIILDGFVPATLPSGTSVLLLHPPVGNSLVRSAADTTVSAVSAVRSGDPLLADVPLDGVHVSRARQLTAPVWGDVVLTSPETPLLIVGEDAGRRIGILGFDVHQSDLPLQPGFPVLIQHLLDWLAPRSGTATPVAQVGDSVSLAPLADAASVEVVTPDDQHVQAGPPFPPAAFTDTNLPGLYRVVQRDTAGRETTSWFAVNFSNAAESQLKPGADSGPPPIGPRREPLKAPHEVWEPIAVAGVILLGLEAALAWWQFAAATWRARLALGLRITTCALLVLALVGVTLPQVVGRQATVFVADVSESTSSAQPALQDFVRQAIMAKRPDDAYAVVTTAHGAATSQVLSTAGGDDPPPLSPMAPTDGTDLAAGLRLAGNLLPASYRPRVVLLSDGQETAGDAVAAARELHARGVEVDSVPVAPPRGPEVLVDSVSTPNTVTQGEHFAIGVRIVSNIQTDATVHVFVNDQPRFDQAVSLSPGTTDLSFGMQAPQSGLLQVRASIDAADDTLAQNNEARSVVEVQGPPRVLIVEQRPGEGDIIASALSSSGVQLERRPVADLPDRPEALGSYSAVVLADVSATSLSDAQQTTLRSYVRDLGRGLVAIGGDTSFGQGEYIGTPLDDALPVHSSVRSHRDQGRVALLLVLDTSGSMSDDPYHEGATKLDMARQAALLSTQELTVRDQVGIMTFDTYAHWALPMSNVLGLPASSIQDRLSPLAADGGTDIYPALSTAFDAIKDSDARFKHIILMTDGQSCCGGDYAGLEDRMRAANVTLSTIAIGSDADTALLSQLAKQGDGRYYFAEHARDIPRLMTRETELATRGPLVEGTITPHLVAPDPLLAGLASGGLPPLGGYLVTTPKDLAEVLLVSDAADPLLARWQYGLGRAVAWTSDLRGRWSQDWQQWPGTAQLFNSLVNWTIAPTTGPLRLSLRADAEAGRISVLDTAPSASPGAVHANVAAPGGQGLGLDLVPTAPGEYTGSFPLTGAGTYIVRAVEERDGSQVGAAEAGLPVSYPAEFRQVTPDLDRMQRIAAAGGGHVLTSPRDAFADDLAPVTTPLPLQRVFIAVAALLLPVEVGLRRLRLSARDVLDWLRHPRRLSLRIPRWSNELPVQAPAWMPGAWATRRRAPPMAWRRRPTEVSFSSVATPGLARQVPEEDGAAEAEDALAAAAKWLASRRASGGDHA